MVTPNKRAISGIKKNNLKKGILEKFATKDVLVHNYLIWNSFNQKPKVSKSKQKLAVLPKSIHISAIRSLFDEFMQWIIAHTHDRDIIVIGNP